MGLTEMQANALEIELLNADLGRFAGEAPVSTIKRELTRALFERPLASVEEVLGWAVTALDKVVTAWERPNAHVDEHVRNGVRQAASILVEAAERAGLEMPVQPRPAQPGMAEPATPDDELAELDEWAPADGGVTPAMFAPDGA